MFRARKKSKKYFRSQKGPKRAKKGHFGSIFQKNESFSKFFFFDLNDSDSKKGQKNDENFFSLLNRSDSVRLCIFFGHRSSKCMLILSFILSSYLSFYLSIFLSFLSLIHI